MSGYPTCADCAAPVKFRDRVPLPRLSPPGDPCRAQAPLPALRPGAAPAPIRRLRDLRARRRSGQASQDHHLRPLRAAAAVTPGTACATAASSPTRTGRSVTPPRRPAAAPASRPGGTISPRSPPPATIPAARSRSCAQAGRLLAADPTASPRQLLAGVTQPDGTLDAAGRALTAFFTSQRTGPARRRGPPPRRRPAAALPGRHPGRAGRRGHRVQRQPARRAGPCPRARGGTQLSDITLETRLRILRDLAVHLTIRPAGHQLGRGHHRRPGAFPRPASAQPPPGHLRAAPLLRWARRRKLILTDPARPLRLGAQPGFTGTVLDAPPSGHCSTGGPTTPPTRTNG